MAFYAKVQTRSSGGSSKGSPQQAMDYLQDDHDSRRETLLDQGEVDYIARTGEGWKRDLEGGQIELHGTGRTAGLDQGAMREQFKYDCVPHYQPTNGSTPTEGYKSITLTLPKEVSLYAEGHREEAIKAMHKAVDEALAKAYPGKEISAVSAVHTRNENGEVHYHAHALVSKFAKDTETGKWGSLNKSAGREEGRLKEGWTEGIKREFEKSFGVKIEQRQDGKANLTFKDGFTLEPLNRNSRRALENEIAPTFLKIRDDGSTYITSFKMNTMDQRIFEIAAQDRGKQGWNREAFEKAFPKEAKNVDRYEKRVDTLKEVGYLNRVGRITQPFKNHGALKWGSETPQLQQIRFELHQAARKEGTKEGRPTVSKTVSQARHENPGMKDRIARLGVSEASIIRFDEQRAMSKGTVTEVQRSIARVEKELKGLPQERKAALKGATNTDQITTIQKSFDAREASLRSQLTSLHDTLKKEVSKGTEGAVKGSSNALQKALPNEAKEGSKEARQAVCIVQSLRGGFRAVSQFIPDETRAVMSKLQFSVRMMNLASSLLKDVKASMPKERVQELKTGLQAGLERRDPTSQAIKSWKGREESLASRAIAQAKGQPTLSSRTFEAAKAMGQQGARIVAAEKPGPPLKLSSEQEKFRGAMETLNRRFEAYGLKAPFSGEAIKSGVAPADLGRILQVEGGGMNALPGSLPGGKGGQDGGSLKDLMQFAGKGTGWEASSPAAVASMHTAVIQAVTKVLEKVAELTKSLGAS